MYTKTKQASKQDVFRSTVCNNERSRRYTQKYHQLMTTTPSLKKGTSNSKFQPVNRRVENVRCCNDIVLCSFLSFEPPIPQLPKPA